MNELTFLIAALLLAAVSIGTLTWLATRSADQFLVRYRDTFTHDARINMQEMFLFVDERLLFRANIAAFFLVPVLVYLMSGTLLFAVIVAAVIGVFPKFSYAMMRRKRLKRFEAQLPDTIVNISSGLRAGASLPVAIEAVMREQGPPVSQEFSLLLRELRLGVSMDEAFSNLAKRVPIPDMDLVVSAVQIAREVGGNLAETLDRLADTLRKKAAMEGKIRSLTSQGKLQGWVVGLLPLVMALVLFKMEPTAMAPLLHSILGWIVVGVIGLLELLGALMIKKIVSIDV